MNVTIPALMIATLALSACTPASGPDASPQLVVASPPRDGTACYDNSRVPFYQVSNTAIVADQQQEARNQNGRTISGMGGVLSLVGGNLGGMSGSLVNQLGQLAAQAGALNASAQTDQRLIADVSASFSALVRCRQSEAQQVRDDVRARRLPAAEGRQRLQALRDLLLVDVDIARRVNAALARRNQTYGVDAAQIDTQVPNEPNPVERQRRGQEVAQARQTIQSNQRALTDQVGAINQAAQTITVS